MDTILNKLTEILDLLRDDCSSFDEFERNVDFAMGFIRQEEDYRNKEGEE